MNPDELAVVRAHYDVSDTSDGFDDGRWEDDVEPDPMATTSVRNR